MINNDPIYNYEKWWHEYKEINRLDPGTRIRKKIIKNELIDSHAVNILDLGCGSGELLVYLNQHLPDKQYYGADVSKKALAIVKQYKLVKATYVVDLEKKEKLNKKFDAIICSEVIEHIIKWKNIIYFLKNNTHKKSTVIITTQAGKKYPHHIRIGHIQHFKIEQINKELLKNGFKIKKAYYMGWPFMNIKNLLLTHFVSNDIYEGKEMSIMTKLVLNIFYFFYSISFRNIGPQIVIIAVKNN